MPVCLYALWIVRLDDMNMLKLLGEQERDLSTSASRVVGAANFVVLPVLK